MTDLPQKVQQIKQRGFAVFTGEGLSDEFRAKFDDPVPVEGIRQIRVWGLQVDDERELPGHERTSIPDEERWEVNIRASNGSCYEVDSELLLPAP